MSLDGGAAGGGLRPPVQGKRRPAAVQQQLVAVRVVPDHPGEDADGHVLGLARPQQRLLEVWGVGRGGGLGDPKKCGVLGEVGDVVGRTVEDVVARVHLGELGHFGHRVAAGWSGADAGLGARHAGLAQPGGTGGVVTTPLGMAERGDVPPTLGNRGVVVGAAPMGAAGSPAGQNTSAKGDLGAVGEPPRMCKGGIQMCLGAPKILWDAPVSFGVPPRCAKAAQIRRVPPK